MAKEKNSLDEAGTKGTPRKSGPPTGKGSKGRSQESTRASERQKAGEGGKMKRPLCDVPSVVADGRAWQKRACAPLRTAPSAEESSRLLALLNGAEFQAAGGLWRCCAQQLLHPEKAEEGIASQGRWTLLLSLGGVSCLCHSTLPSTLREELEAMSEPYRLEELPASVALGLFTLTLSPLLRELFVVPCRLVEQGVGVEKEIFSQGEEVFFRLEVLPLASKVTPEGTTGGEEERAYKALRLDCRLAARDLETVRQSLRVRRRTRTYPQNLYTTWQLDAGGTSLSLEEFQSLKEGDVLLLS